MPGALAVPLSALRRKADEAREAVAGAIAGLQGKITDTQEQSSRRAVIPKGRVYTSPLRNGNFAAIIPGDSVVEGVITTGVASTLCALLTGPSILICPLNDTLRTQGSVSLDKGVVWLSRRSAGSALRSVFVFDFLGSVNRRCPRRPLRSLLLC
jgi:hypothetical protein